MSVSTASLQLPKRPGRRAVAVDALRFRTVARIVADHGGRLDHHATVVELRRHGLTAGAAIAAVRRARIRGDVVLDVDGFLTLPDGDEAA